MLVLIRPPIPIPIPPSRCVFSLTADRSRILHLYSADWQIPDDFCKRRVIISLSIQSIPVSEGRKPSTVKLKRCICKPIVARHSRVLLCRLLSPDLLLCSDSLSCCLPSSSSRSICSNNCTEIDSILQETTYCQRSVLATDFNVKFIRLERAFHTAYLCPRLFLALG